MAVQRLFARVVGIPHIPTVREINVRSGAGTNQALVFRAPVGLADLPVLEVQRDVEGKNFEGKVYQWFRVMFPNNQPGWARDDLIEIYGDGAAFGYPSLATPALAFNLVRREIATPTVAQPIQPVAPVTGFGAPGQPIGVRSTQPIQPIAPPTGFQLQPPVTTFQPQPPVTTFQPQPPVTTFQPVAPVQPVAPPAQPAPPEELGPATAICMAKTGANMRPGPGTNHTPVVGRMNYHDTARILEVAPGQDGIDFKWVKLDYRGTVAWIREDFIRLTGAFGPTGLAPQDLYPNPAPRSWWVRDFDLTGKRIQAVHHGWDHAGEIGAPILAGPKGGVVVKVASCAKCGAEGISVVQKGFQLSDPRVLNDPGWNFGYGHYVIVRYDNHILPESTRNYLATQSMSGGQVHVMYAHLHQILVQEGANLAPSQQVGTLGNSGNSSGAHLHLEVRIGTDPNAPWSRLLAGLRTPGIIFLR